MPARIDYTKVGSGALRAMHGLEKYLAESSIEAPLREQNSTRLTEQWLRAVETNTKT